MRCRFRRGLVLGAGVMGSQIAAALAGAGLDVDLLDLGDGELAARGLARLRDMHPVPFFEAADLSRIRPGSIEADLATAVSAADWVVEAIVEEAGPKRALWRAVAAAGPQPAALLTTNTSGLSVADLAASLDDARRSRFLGCHFFNPVRRLRLVELIPTRQTDPDAVDDLERFLRDRLGREPIRVRDRPNFLANRVGILALQTALAVMVREGLPADLLDAVTGPALARAPSATCGTVDRIGLGTYLRVLGTGREGAADGRERDLMTPPPPLAALAERGLTFYRHVGERREVLAWSDLTYRPASPPPPGMAAVLREADPATRVRRMVAEPGPAGACARAVLRDTLACLSGLLADLAPSVEPVDRVLRLGFGWQCGPFELWQDLGLDWVRSELGIEAPADVRRAGGFYRDGRAFAAPAGWLPLAADTRDRAAAGPAVLVANEGRLLDLGDGVACLRLEGFNDALSAAGVELADRALTAVEDEDRWAGLVIVSGGASFCVGADLSEILATAEAADWPRLEGAIRDLQTVTQRLRYLPCPAVAVARGYALGGGAEILLHALRVEAEPDLRMGLVETGIGLVPAGGGCLALLARLGAERAFDLIRRGARSQSAAEAVRWGLLRPSDHLVPRPERLLDCAVRAVRFLAEVGHRAPAHPALVAGGPEQAAVLLESVRRASAESLTPHDLLVAESVAAILTGGGRPAGRTVTEEDVLALERETFVRLAGQAETQARIRRLLRR